MRAASGLDAHTPLPMGVVQAKVFALETRRQVGSDRVVRYQHRGLQVTPARAEQRHVALWRQVLVRENATGGLRVLVCDPQTRREHALAWTPLAVVPTLGAAVPRPTPLEAVVLIAGSTAAG